MDTNKNIKAALLEAIWITRWNKDKTSLKSVLTPDEAERICDNIVDELNIAGYEIVQKLKR